MATKRKKELKIVELDGKDMVATKYEGDINWVVSHDTQEDLKKEYEAQNV